MNNFDEEAKKVMKAEAIVIVFAVLMLVCLLFAGCKTCACVPEIEYRDSIHTEYRVKYDSVYQYVHDSCFIKEKGDTVLITKYKTIIRDKYVMSTDTVYKEVGSEIVQTETTNILTKSQKDMIAGFWVLLVLIIIALALLVWRKWKPIVAWFARIIAKF